MWNANDFCKRFKEKKTALEFTEEWDVWLSESNESRSEDIPPQDTDDGMPPAKKPCSEKWMDDIDFEIEKHKVGTLLYVVIFL